MQITQEKFYDLGATFIEITKLAEPPKEIWKKRNNSALTNLDLSLQKDILHALRRDWWGIPVISEEMEESFELLKKGGLAWVVDPLDGTHDVAADRPQECTVLAGLLDLDKGRPIGGIAIQPFLQKPKALASFGTIRRFDYATGKWVPFVRKPSAIPEIGLDLSRDSTPEYWERSRRLVQVVGGRVVNLPAGASHIGVIEGSLSCTMAEKHHLWDDVPFGDMYHEIGGCFVGIDRKPLPWAQPEMPPHIAADSCERVEVILDHITSQL